MNYLVCLCLLALTRLAAAETPTEAYLAARDQAIERMTNFESSQTDPNLAWKEHEKLDRELLGQLGDRLREIIGPIGLPKFSSSWAINLATLAPSMEFGNLDGLAGGSEELAVSVIVTTSPLLNAWVKEHCPRFEQ